MGKLKRRLESAPRHGWPGESMIPNLDYLIAGTMIQFLGSAHVDDACIDGVHLTDYSWYPLPENIAMTFMVIEVEEGNLRHRVSSDLEFMGYNIHLDDSSQVELLPSYYLNPGIQELVKDHMIDYVSVQGMCYRVIATL